MEYMEALLKRVRSRADYRECLQKLNALEPEFVKLRDSLDETAQSILDKYIALCEEMDDIMCAVAYELGSQHMDDFGPMWSSAPTDVP